MHDADADKEAAPVIMAAAAFSSCCSSSAVPPQPSASAAAVRSWSAGCKLPGSNMADMCQHAQRGAGSRRRDRGAWPGHRARGAASQLCAHACPPAIGCLPDAQPSRSPLQPARQASPSPCTSEGSWFTSQSPSASTTMGRLRRRTPRMIWRGLQRATATGRGRSIGGKLGAGRRKAAAPAPPFRPATVTGAQGARAHPAQPRL